MKYPLLKTSIERVQKRLLDLSIYQGKIDGDAGPLTLKAIKGFQRIHGLTPDGIIGPATEAAMFPILMPGGRREVALPIDAVIASQTLVTHYNSWPYERDVEKYYGPKGKNQAFLELPYTMFLAWDLAEVVTHISVHEKVHDSALRCFNRIANAYSASQRHLLGLDLYGGSLNVRRKRGGSGWSMHSWGIAIDFDPLRNQLHMNHLTARLAQPDADTFFRIWQEESWISLGKSRDMDFMHVQAARLG